MISNKSLQEGLDEIWLVCLSGKCNTHTLRACRLSVNRLKVCTSLKISSIARSTQLIASLINNLCAIHHPDCVLASVQLTSNPSFSSYVLFLHSSHPLRYSSLSFSSALLFFSFFKQHCKSRLCCFSTNRRTFLSASRSERSANICYL